MESKIEIINNWNLKKLILELETGNIKIPRFQRDYIWDRNKVIKLFNSIYLQYPIGSIFLWSAPKNYRTFIRETEYLEIKSIDTDNEVNFILDGQQRIVSLFATLRGKTVEDTDYSRICFNLKKKQFYIPRKKTEKFNIPVWNVFDDVAYSEVLEDLKAYDKNHNKSYATEWENFHNIFMNYPISIVKTNNEDLDDVVEIFERINQGGNKLTLYDLVHATVLDHRFDLKDRVLKFNKEPKIKKIGGIPNRIIVQSLSINVYENCSSTYQLKLTSEICLKVWDLTIGAIQSAIDFLTGIGIQTDMVQYHSFIPVLQYYFYNTKFAVIHPSHQKQMEKWFWDSKFSNRYSNSSISKMKEDVIWIKELTKE